MPDHGPVRRVVKAAAFVVRHPKDAYRALYAQTRPAVPVEAEPARFEHAMHLLTGLDVSLTFQRDGVTWTVPPGEDGIATDLYENGAYSGETIAAVLTFVAARRPGCGWFIDVGANVGTTTVPFAAAGFNVLAIEPVPTCQRYLRANVASNGLAERVEVFEGAVAAGADEVLMAVSTSLGSSEVISTPSSTPGFDGNYGHAGTINVRAVGLDEIVGSLGIEPASVAIVWSDTQGSETSVIETGSTLWTAGVPLFVEFCPRLLDLDRGVGAFIDQARGHFREFIDASGGGYRIAETLRPADGRGSAPRPVSQLTEFTEEVALYPAGFTDILLLP